MEKVKIEIWSDVVCPFCFLGKKIIDQAIEELGSHNRVDIVWRSFQLDPNFPQNDSMMYYRYHFKRSGYTEEQLKPMGQKLNLEGNKYDIKYKFENVHVVNSLNLHRLLIMSKEFKLYDELNEAIMTAYFTNGIDLSSHEELLKITAQVGLDNVKAQTVLSSQRHLEEVTTDMKKARELGISGVPYFLISQTESISGAPDVSVFKKVISTAIAKLKS